MPKKYITLLVLIALFLFGCTSKDIKDEQVYLIEGNSGDSQVFGEKINTEGTVPFQAYEALNFEERVLLTISPDGKELYFIEPMEDEGFEVIKGEPKVKVRLIKVNKENHNEDIIAQDIPFISIVQWNNTGKIVAFGGGERLMIYDTVRDRLLLEDTLEDDKISYFFWSPKDENKLYTENPNLSNGSIYYVNSRKKVEAYETKEQLYYKGRLDNNYFFATKWFTLENQNKKLIGNNDGIRTLIVDKTGNEVKILGKGRFRDSYQKSLLHVGDSGFGLFFTPDINQPNKIRVLTEDYVFDAKFVDGGKIAYIIENKDLESNLFSLYIMDKDGKELNKVKVSGSCLALLPDGKTGYIGGSLWEKVDFVENEIKEGLVVSDEQGDSEKEDIYKTLRKAVNILAKFDLKGEKDKVEAKKSFVDTNTPDQWAYFDILNQFNESSNLTSNNLYRLKMELTDVKHNEVTGSHLSTTVRATAFSNSGGITTMEYALELIKKDNRWYVTGLSTFPFSEQRFELEKVIKNYVSDAQNGKIFPGELEGKEVEIGQIQFWASGIPRLAVSIESADYCKVYLKVNNNGKQEIWKLILDKKNQNYWNPTKLAREKLGGL